MGRKTETKEITLSDGETLTLKATQLAATSALKLASRLVKVLAPLASANIKMNDDASKLVPLASSMLAALDGDEIISLALALFNSTLGMSKATGGKLLGLGNADAINIVFDGELLALAQALVFSVQLNFRDFFRGVGSGAGPAADPATATPSA